MNRLLYSLFFIGGLNGVLTAQTYDLCMDVTASAGGQGAQGNKYLAWTIGEPFVKTLSSNGVVFTQGFQQPDACGKSFVSTRDWADWQLSLFPNPTEGLSTLRFSTEKKGPLRCIVYDLLGRPMTDLLWMHQAEGTLLDASSWPAGLYLVHLSDPLTQSATVLSWAKW